MDHGVVVFLSRVNKRNSDVEGGGEATQRKWMGDRRMGSEDEREEKLNT